MADGVMREKHATRDAGKENKPRMARITRIKEINLRTTAFQSVLSA